MFFDLIQGFFRPTAGENALHGRLAARISHVDQYVARLELIVGAGGDVDALAPLHGHDGGPCDLPDPQIPDAHADLVGVLRDHHLIVGEVLLRRQGIGLGVNKLCGQIHKIPPHGGVLLVELADPILQRELLLPGLHIRQILPGLFRGDHDGAAALLHPDDAHVRQKAKGLAHGLRGNAVFRGQGGASGEALLLPELSQGDAGSDAHSDPHVLRKNIVSHRVPSVPFVICLHYTPANLKTQGKWRFSCRPLSVIKGINRFIIYTDFPQNREYPYCKSHKRMIYLRLNKYALAVLRGRASLPRGGAEGG